MHEALYYKKLTNQKVTCQLCPHNCKINPDQTGICGVRKNTDGILYSLIYEKGTSLALDPIEKKPLYHYHSGEKILSLGTKGCNLKCDFCQNWQISQDKECPIHPIHADDIIYKAKQAGSFGIAWTYNEPFIWYEFILDCGKKVKKEGLENVLVTNGFINPEPLEEILPIISAMNIDVKSIDDDFYKKTCGGRVEPVLKCAERAKKSCHVEITNLVIPGLNDKDDNFERLGQWIAEKLSPDTPLHLSCYYPCHKSFILETPIETLKKAEQICRNYLEHVYLGNI